MKKHNCKCSLIAGNVVPNPECPVHVEVVRVAPSRSAAPPSEREALELVLHVLNSAPKQGWDKWRNAVDIVEGWQARAAVPKAAQDESELLKAAKLTVLHFERNCVSGNEQGDDEHEAWTALNKAISNFRARAAAVPAPGREWIPCDR